MTGIESTMKQVGIVPVIKHFMKELNVFGFFKEQIPCATQAQIEPAELLCMLIPNIMVDASPLYSVDKWVAKYADGLGEDIEDAQLFNDDRLGWALDKLFEADRGTLLTKLSVKAIEVHQLETNAMHNDTTTVTLQGDYDRESEDAVKIRHGYNKDYRPDCKQIVFGLTTTDDGHVPIHYQLFDGNQEDTKTHKPIWEELSKIIGTEDFIYVADSKLCTFDNLETIASHGGQFIAMIPKSRKEVKEFYKELEGRNIEWETGYTKPHSRKSEESIVFRTHEERSADGYRVIWVHSSSKEIEDLKRRNKAIETIKEKLQSLSKKINRYNLKTEVAIESAIKKIASTHIALFDIDLTKNKIIKNIKKGRGRPSSESEYAEVERIEYKLTWKLDEKKVEAVSTHDGVFPLITNTQLKAKEVLLQYKEQPFLEKRHSTLKSVLNVAPVFLKKPERIEALMFLYFIAMMVLGLMERRIRLSMRQEKIESLQILPAKMKTKSPTFNNIRQYFEEIHMAVITIKKKIVSVSTKGISRMHAFVLRLLKIPDDLYKNLKNNWWRFDFLG